MRRLPDEALPDVAATWLRTWQDEVDQIVDYSDRVETAAKKFTSRNRKGNPTFDAVKAALDKMCAGVRRCVYCEDSLADEVEHLRPKYFYPEQVFAWLNYVYACGPCNLFKGSRFAVFPSGPGSGVEFDREPKKTPGPPPAGVAGLIDPRTEDVHDLLGLDLQDTFYYVPRSVPGTLAFERAEATITLLGLNDRDALPKARRAAFTDFESKLVHSRDCKQAGDTQALDRLADQIRSRQHPTVWHEMKRQQRRHAHLAALFDAVPEALAW